MVNSIVIITIWKFIKLVCNRLMRCDLQYMKCNQHFNLHKRCFFSVPSLLENKKGPRWLVKMNTLLQSVNLKKRHSVDVHDCNDKGDFSTCWKVCRGVSFLTYKIYIYIQIAYVR